MTDSSDDLQPLDEAQCLSILAINGPIAKTLKDYEQRSEQKEMLRNIIEAYNHSHIALVEAGTGTGKSLAYLIPAILWALQNQTVTVISTNTIALQEQLLEKDIPFLINALGVEIKAVLVKGMSNYLCKRKLEEGVYEKRFLESEELSEYEKIEMWANQTSDGSKSELPFVPKLSVWEKVGAEADSCNHLKCPHYKECFFFKARKCAADAQIIIVNHHLLFADLSARSLINNYQDPLILPPYQNIILDEAHHIEDVATEYFAQKISRLGVMRLLSRLITEKRSEHSGKLIILKQKIEECFPEKDHSEEISRLLLKIEMEIPAEKRNLLTLSGQLFDAFAHFLDNLGISGEENPGEKKLRLRPNHFENSFWKENIIPLARQFLNQITSFAQSLTGLIQTVEKMDEWVVQKTSGIRVDLEGIARQLEKMAAAFNDFAFGEENKEYVRWVEALPTRSFINIHLVHARLEMAGLLHDFLFTRYRTLILCSATLTANQKFDYLKGRLGLNLIKDKKITESVYASPFNYTEQALVAIPCDMPDPSLSQFTTAASQKIIECIEASRGGVFILFTSYQMLKAVYSQIIGYLEKGRYRVFRQGDDNRKSLLNNFKASSNGVLFGTDSFWEGVDVVGEALRCVILVKLPFKVPSEPLIQARIEAIAERGGNPFMEYTIPSAIVKFKQGFGRLIRNRKDRGCVVCLDPRLIKKGYGKMFLNSLPECQSYIEGDNLKEAMKEFYKKTYFLVKK